MPTYDYECSACGHRFEEFQSMSAKPLKKCPECGKNALERLIGIGAGIIFKGGGFYETDYRSDSYKKAAEADTKASSGHTHTDSCACGQKTKSECASGAGANGEASTAKPTSEKSSSAKMTASVPKKSSGSSRAKKPSGKSSRG
ncbi:MAG TPA: zinc ribbon domain-containing protein [Phycisphaerales bacterium]|nr:zinc ribbon domain-containing protein [Phycisphaerales bacterium]